MPDTENRVSSIAQQKGSLNPLNQDRCDTRTNPQTIAPRSITANSNLFFKAVMGEGRENRCEIMRTFFNTVMHRIYGSQHSAISKIEVQPSDRSCRLLYDGSMPVGIIVYPKALSFDCFPESLEIITLGVLDKVYSGRGYGTALLNKIEEVAIRLKAQSIHVSVNSSVPDAMEFFKKKGFVVARLLPRLEGEGSIESLLVKKITVVQARTIDPLEKSKVTTVTGVTQDTSAQDETTQGSKRKPIEILEGSEQQPHTQVAFKRINSGKSTPDAGRSQTIGHIPTAQDKKRFSMTSTISPTKSILKTTSFRI
jgi:GNAT superfamily N-acetyltransferase